VGLTLSLIAAVAANGCIGRAGDLPWHIPQDLRHFKRLTMGRPVIMGRVTYEGIVARLGGPLPGRENIVLSRRGPSLDEALAGREGEVFVAGGAQIYALALPRADRIYLTRVHREVDGDAFFPPLDGAQWAEVAREDHEGFAFVTLERAPRPGAGRGPRR
jgi:dihydrofolate reductase